MFLSYIRSVFARGDILYHLCTVLLCYHGIHHRHDLRNGKDLDDLKSIVSEYCKEFDLDADEILDTEFTVLTPDSKNPYKQMYVAN